ncbi:MAG: 16S rRNA (adenine(1518)-N(6)/adenine(1519)-N(6))-dimethyltransferase RsmA [Actinomycetia bacterium]|nr:16S rRNA (adenine(1518)-N(6)/adenine(1519)-N(6))-dimethyltransferase RsmA [Actinomycetes bacterium]
MLPAKEPALLSGRDIRELAERLQVNPRKALGQNFVVDPNTIRRIVRVAEVTPQDHVLEVGPGLGSLTLGLLGVAEQVTAVEIDPRLATALTDTVSLRAPQEAENLTVLQADATTITADVRSPTSLVANLPYNVGVPILLHCLQVYPSLRHGAVMVQREVADRLVAGPGGADYGVPSLKLAWYARARRVGKVPPSVFWPMPRVDSTLVAFTRHESVGSDQLRKRVFTLVNTTFGQRRKTLRASLKAHYEDGHLTAALARSGLEPSLRPQELALTDFVRLAEALAEPSESEPVLPG